MSEFKENIIFELEKNKPLKNTDTFRYKIFKTYGLRLTSDELYKKIVNYQIDKNGITIDEFVPRASYKEKKLNNNAANNRKYYARKRRENS